MAADFEVKLEGAEELKAALRGLPEKLRRRVLHGAVAYDITAVLPDEERHEYVDLVAERVE